MTRDVVKVERGCLALKRLPDVSTVSRSLASADGAKRSAKSESSRALWCISQHTWWPGTIRELSTLDFDGSVLSTGRHAEGTAVRGSIRKRTRCAQLLPPVLHRRPDRQVPSMCIIVPGNVHDLQRCRHLHRALCAVPCARACLAAKHRGPYRQRVQRQLVADPCDRLRLRWGPSSRHLPDAVQSALAVSKKWV